MQDLNVLTVFVRAAQSGSFSVAARALGMTPSGVSRAVSRLEAELGVRLLHRTTRRLSATPEGAEFLTRCRAILDDIADAEAAVSSVRAEPRGRLRVSAPATLGRLRLVPALVDLAARHPELRVEAVLTDRAVDLVEEGFDAALRVGRLEDSRLVTRRLAPLRYAVCASPSYLERCGVPRRPQDLADGRHNCLAYVSARTGQALGWRFRGDGGGEIVVTPKGSLAVNDSAALVGAALTGAGLACVHRYLVAEHVASGRLRTVLEDEMAEGDDLWAVYPHRRHLASRVRAFLEFAAAWADDAVSYCGMKPGPGQS